MPPVDTLLTAPAQTTDEICEAIYALLGCQTTEECEALNFGVTERKGRQRQFLLGERELARLVAAIRAA